MKILVEFISAECLTYPLVRWSAIIFVHIGHNLRQTINKPKSQWTLKNSDCVWKSIRLTNHEDHENLMFEDVQHINWQPNKVYIGFQLRIWQPKKQSDLDRNLVTSFQGVWQKLQNIDRLLDWRDLNDQESLPQLNEMG